MRVYKSCAGNIDEDNELNENQQNVVTTSTPTPIKPNLLRNLFPHNIPTISFQTKSPKKKSEDERTKYPPQAITELEDTSVDYNPRLQLQHRKESFSFSSPYEYNESNQRPLFCSSTKSYLPMHNVRKSNQSAFTVVSPSRIGYFQSLINPSQHGQSSAVKNLSSFSEPTYQRETSSMIEPSNTGPKPIFHIPNKPLRTANSSKTSTSSSSNVYQPSLGESYLSDIQEEDNINESFNHPVASSSTSQQGSQTVFFTLPQNINLQQISNQPLSLDPDSRNLLQSILQLSQSGSEKEDTVLERSAVELDDSRQLVIDVQQEEKHISRHIQTSPEETVSNQTETTHKTTTNMLSEATNIPTSKQKDNSEELPTATINVEMVDEQPVYYIQLTNGLTIPIAAITIPTSDGTKHLQSGVTSLPTTPKSNQPQPETQTADKEVQPEQPEVCQSNTTVTTTPTISSQKKKKTSSETKEKLTCDICGKSYIRPWSYHSHLREHEEEPKEHKCMTCNKTFATVNGLKQHLSGHHFQEKQKEFLCTICNKNFNNASALRLHQYSHASEKIFKCLASGCEKAFPNASALRIHQRVHQEDKPYKCTHDSCNKAFKTPSELSRHEFRHTGEKPYKCDKCTKSFVRNDDLKRHSFIHTGQKKFKCELCDFSCIQSFDLVKHKYIHGGEKPYKCKMCPKQFTRPARLREHERLHTGERPYTCEECGKSFSQLTSLKSHKLTHDPPGSKPFYCLQCNKDFTNEEEFKAHAEIHERTKHQCQICQKTFVSGKTLKRHAIVHSGEKPYECRVCHKRFARAGDLKVHSPVHHEEKPYKCDQCSKTFSRFSSLKEHIRLHTGKFPFKCEICDKIFNHRSHLNVHLQTHTGEKPHKCFMCPKEFSRKSSLKQHLRTHGITDASSVSSTITRPNEPVRDDDVDSNFSDGGFMEGTQGLHVDPTGMQIWKSMQTAMKHGEKRKRTASEDTEDGGLLPKRLMTDPRLSGYPNEQILSDMGSENIQGQETSSVTHVVTNPYATGHGHFLHSDGTPVVFSYEEGNEHEIDGLVMHGLEGLQNLDAQTMIGQQQPLLNQSYQELSAGLAIPQLAIQHTTSLPSNSETTDLMTNTLRTLHQ